MSRRTGFLIAAVVLLIAAIAYDTHVVAKVSASRDEATTLARRYAQVMRQIHFRPGLDANGGGATVSRRRDETGAASAATEAPVSAKSNLSPRQLIASDAELLKKYMTDYRAGLDVEYGLFIHMLALSPADTAQFKQLMGDMEANKLQVAQTAANEGLDLSDPQMKALQRQLNSPDWTGLNQLLGPSGMSTLQQYKSEWPTVTLVQNFGANLPEPTLTVDQAQQLLPILSSASERDSTGTVIPNTIDVQQALTESAPVLSTDQLVILTAMLQEAEAKAKISQLSQGH
jgi:hypothetical protein